MCWRDAGHAFDQETGDLLEWVEDGVYRSLQAPAFDLAGLLDQAIEVTDLFLPRGAEIVATAKEAMKDLEKRLDPRRFQRVHRSTIVNLDHVREIQPYFHGAYVLVLQNGTEVRLSRARRHAFEEALGQTL